MNIARAEVLQPLSLHWQILDVTRDPPLGFEMMHLDKPINSRVPRHPCATGQRWASSWPARAQTTYLGMIIIAIVSRRAQAALAAGFGASNRPWPTPPRAWNSAAVAGLRRRWHAVAPPPRSQRKLLAAAHPIALDAPLTA